MDTGVDSVPPDARDAFLADDHRTTKAGLRERWRLDFRLLESGIAAPRSANAILARETGSNSTAGDMLRRAAADSPDKIAVVGHDGTLTFAAIDRLTESTAAGLLDAGLRPGERVIFQIGTVKEIFVALYACFKAGIVPVCTLPQYREIEIQKLAERSGATAYLVQADVHPSFDQLAFARRMRAAIPQIAHLIVTRGTAGPGELSLDALAQRFAREDARARVRPHDPDPDDVAAFQMSGGSTGLPKIIPRTHAEYLGSAAALGRRYELTENDISLWSLPLIHNAGMLFVVLPVAIAQRTVVALPRFEFANSLMPSLAIASRSAEASVRSRPVCSNSKRSRPSTSAHCASSSHCRDPTRSNATSA